MSNIWDADPGSNFKRRPGRSPAELKVTAEQTTCPDLWELDNGDYAVIGRRHTADYSGRLPADVSVGSDEEIVIIPRVTLQSAKPHIPDL